MPEVIGTIAELRDRLSLTTQNSAVAGADTRVVLVPTMGALHAGHLALARRARELGDTVVVSIFVNPLQFGAGEDLDRYPRTLDADVAALAELGVPYVFAPSAQEMYPDGAAETRVSAGPVGSLYEGAARPGHFDGMLTVVAKLINIVDPDAAVFGQKDGQQLYLIKRMVAELNFRLAIDVVPTVREEGGLALSSRNRFLDPEQRESARALSAGLGAAASVASQGAPAALAAAHAVIEAQPLVKLDYLVVVHPQTFLPVDDDYRGPARMLVAALVGSTRLIDNVPLDIT
ncbi:pantoate--beta-alanine ligase [Cryobacterium tagatosivorans]|uniref:Pantothenate synthetase n=1 Tax=Cryobacterium tagatosivorans TaxID=1259199 RepID=A0A4R8UHP0_9MICO|nr:pantoate--beta-alanine ligase [Cryobacterium tagatosivorans]TFB52474.1 pantoate--beta-alanine ligase [Cryobacterium tagatosivorans]